MNSIQIEELERYLEEIPDNGNLVSEFEDSYLDEFDIIHPLDRVENIEEFYIQNLGNFIFLISYLYFIKLLIIRKILFLDVVFDDKKPTSDGNSNKGKLIFGIMYIVYIIHMYIVIVYIFI